SERMTARLADEIPGQTATNFRRVSRRTNPVVAASMQTCTVAIAIMPAPEASRTAVMPTYAICCALLIHCERARFPVVWYSEVIRRNGIDQLTYIAARISTTLAVGVVISFKPSHEVNGSSRAAASTTSVAPAARARCRNKAECWQERYSRISPRA